MRVVALDDVVRALFQEQAASIPQLRKVCWINPDRPHEQPLDWLQEGAPAHAFRMLGYVPDEE